MWRYVRLYAHFVRFSVSRSLQFRFDFFFRVVMDTLYYAVNLAFYKILFLNMPSLVGWNESQALIFVAGYCVVDALQMTLFANNVWNLSNLINKGDLDYYLVRPVSSLFFVSLRDFALNSFLNFLIAAGILAWAVHHYPPALSVGSVALYALLLLNGACLHGLLHIAFVLPVFWTHSGRGFDQIFWNFTRCMERPDRIFTGGIWRLVTILIPFGVMVSFPARLLLEPFDQKIFLHLAAVTLGLFAFVVSLWRYGLRSYSSASS